MLSLGSRSLPLSALGRSKVDREACRTLESPRMTVSSTTMSSTTVSPRPRIVVYTTTDSTRRALVCAPATALALPAGPTDSSTG